MIESAERARHCRQGVPPWPNPRGLGSSIIAAVAFIWGSCFHGGTEWTCCGCPRPPRAFPRDRWRPAPDGIRTILK